MNLKIRPTAILVLCVAVGGLLLSGIHFAISTASIEPQPTTAIDSSLSLPPPPPANASIRPASPNRVASPAPSPSDLAETESSDRVPSASVQGDLGALRVSNRTDHPVRIALLQQPPEGEPYGEPVHWDFAPGEGSQKGLLLSLPDQTLQVRQGDVLVAFAQDGSRWYWGPYVVGKTTSPTWSDRDREWRSILQLQTRIKNGNSVSQ